MAEKRTVTTLAEYPKILGSDPAVSASRMGDLVNTTGILGVDPRTGQLGSGPEEQFDLAYQNMTALLQKAGLTLDEAGLVTVFIPGPDYRQYINKGWTATFPDENNRPARKTNHVNLPEGAFVQLQVAAVAGGRRERLEVQGLAHRDPIPNGVKIGNMVYSSVIVPQDLSTAETVKGEVPQIQQCYDNTKVFMGKAGATLDDVLHMWVFMSDFKYQPDMVDLWVKAWPNDGDRPSRKTLRYPMGGLIQVQATGVIRSAGASPAGAGAGRTNYEIPGVGHHDPIPMGAKVGNVFMSSGISGVEPDLPNGRHIEAVKDLDGQIKWAQHGVEALLKEAGGGLDNVALLTVLIQDFNVIPVVDRAWKDLYGGDANRPPLKFIDWRIPGTSHVQYHVTGVF